MPPASTLYGSWGYQVTGYFAPTSRYGTPDDLRYLVDVLHQHGVGVILDWVPAHFPNDPHGLATFDGTHLFEHQDPRRGIHPDWKTHVFNYDRAEVRSFLLSSATYWLESFHIDGLRVDAVASMLYRDYSREDGEWVPNEWGGREDEAAASLLKQMNAVVREHFPGAFVVAEESTSWPGVTSTEGDSGLGFGLKWDMGWMHDTLRYLARDPVHRRYHHDDLTFRAIYAHSERYVLALSHDEVVHGKGALPNKFAGDAWQQLATLRMLFGYQAAQPGKSLVFMGMEFGQRSEWNHEGDLDWHLLDDPLHRGALRWTRAINKLVAREPALHQLDAEPRGVTWSGFDHADCSVLCLVRHAEHGRDVVAIINATPIPRYGYRVGVPRLGRWVELANSDAEEFGGSGVTTGLPVHASDTPWMGLPCSIVIGLPPLSAVLLAAEEGA